ncbi:methylated-DNA--[protein]-cysteine S-methyltransferase [Nocardia asteroides]|uniref:Methylated-DNA--protein-cysteine methyltransferase n=1 Tax=Nocardia asteroides NBRC 15531 TaxID=1110697 RepID=U5EAK0_NOCAS|nr:methylated-DNA--[protein]-cysteine S-methyltransferase [Nocardia asteroides]TLF70007.1 methylated-DNA--[protein]-cysteine S-methyltransferase [Nocardia asteroides NBRC 15531]UGT49530.1 methylated-DNA--[protein]-cysteine S-methyltransferase [Nocardia asteroides]SFL93616.1 methylated-DNA-[protein]-cysteine S-methyltransferase [Nocardia asteroides]VEG37847.1 Methylated-DNA--protein-cysteine methyltransferase [Nocardia asteroides]GAD84390.1 putative methylated-DNA--protein-cysteine methyltransf
MSATITRLADVATVPTPIGPFTVIVDADGAVLGSGWTADPAELTTVIHVALRPSELRRRDSLGEVTRAVTDYHAGDLTAIDAIPVHQRSGEFLSHAWDVLRKVPAGEPVTYTEFAGLSGRPAATRAAANACARNAAALFVPCHRVLRIGGQLGGFRWGLDAKRWLLAHEA